MYRNLMRNRLILNDAFPTPLTNSLFSQLTSAPWYAEKSAAALDFQYFWNRSGEKFASPAVERLAIQHVEATSPYALTSSDIEALASTILACYNDEWTRLWENYHLSSYDPLTNFNIETDKSGGDTHSSTKQGAASDRAVSSNVSSNASTSSTEDSSTKDGVESSNSSASHQKSTTENEKRDNSTQQSNSTTDTQRGTVDTSGTSSSNEASDASSLDGYYGFNSSASSPVSNSGSQSASSSSDASSSTEERNLSNSGVSSSSSAFAEDRDKTSVDESTDSNSSVNSNRVSSSGSSVTNNSSSGSDSSTKDSESTTSETTASATTRSSKEEVKGYRLRDNGAAKLLKDDRELWMNAFFEKVFSDIDKVLTCPMFCAAY